MLSGNKKHEVYTVNKHKIWRIETMIRDVCKNRDDDKRRVQEDCIITLARGYLA